MGVYGLATLLAKDDRFFEYVSISERDKGTFEKSIAIDGNSLLHKVLENVEWQAGSFSADIYQKSQTFFNHILYHNLKCVVFFDGNQEQRKRETANERLLERSGYAHAFITNPLGRNRNIRPSLTYTIFSHALFQLRDQKPEGVIEVIQCSLEADPYIAHYAQTHDECIGVLSKDSDFCIFRDTVYFPYNTISLSRSDFIVQRFNSTQLTKTLKLTPELLVLLAIQLGTDHLKRKDKIGSKKLFDNLVSELQGVTNVEEYISNKWQNSNVFAEAQSFYLELTSHQDLSPSLVLKERNEEIPLTKEDMEIFDIIDKKKAEGSRCIGLLMFLFKGETVLPVLAISSHQNYLLWTRVRYIRELIYQLFLKQLVCFDYCVEERLPNQKSIKVIPIRLKECPTLSVKKIRSMIQRFVPLCALPEVLVNKLDFPYFSILDALSLKLDQKEVLVAYMCIPEDDRDVILPLWCSFVGEATAKWFCLLLLILHRSEPLSDSEMISFCDYFLQSMSGKKGSNIKAHLTASHIKRARHLHFSLEVGAYHTQWITGILDFPNVYLTHVIKWLQPTLFFDVYKNSLRPKRTQNRQELNDFVELVKNTIQFEGKKKKEKSKKAPVAPKISSAPLASFHNSFGALRVE